MEDLKNISDALKAAFVKKPIFKVLLPLDAIFLFGGVGIMIVNQFVSVGTLLYPIGYYLFFMGVLLAVANYRLNFLYMGFLSYGALGALRLVYGLFKYKYLNYDALIIILIFGGLGFLLFKNFSNNKLIK